MGLNTKHLFLKIEAENAQRSYVRKNIEQIDT